MFLFAAFKAPVRIGVIFKHLRKLMDSLLEKKLENPRMNLEGKVRHHSVTVCLQKKINVLNLICSSVLIADDPTIQVILDLIKSEHSA